MSSQSDSKSLGDSATWAEPPHVHHMDAPTAYHAAKLGMWLFLATEILLFGGLFAAFALYRWMYLDQFHSGSHHLSKIYGAINTAVLILSSFTAALAVDAAQHGKNKQVLRYLSVTVTCAFAFLVIKSIEYHGKASHNLFPFTFECSAESGSFLGICTSEKFQTEVAPYKAFFGLYYCMTGLHALHVIIGMGILIWVMSKARKNQYSPVYYTPVEVGALYWHLVDLIWIYLFPLLYLVG